MPNPHQSVLDGFRRFRAAWPHRGWSLDNRFDCVASSFGADFAPQARVLLTPIFPHVISERTLPAASLPIRELAARTGGVRAAQMIFGADMVGRVTPYGLWWPWEEAQTVSLRIGLEGASLAELEDVYTCFGVER